LPGERQLADRFHLSRSTVREALQFLAALDLVEIRRGGGCFVCSNPIEAKGLHAGWVHWVNEHRGQVLETLEVRLGCEVFAARLAARRARPAELAKLVEALRKMKAASDSQDAPAFVQSDVDFHAALLEASGNGTLRELVGALGKTLIPERAAIAGISGRTARSFGEHCAIYDAVQQGDAQAAGLAMQRHLESVRYDVLVHLLGDVDAASATPDHWDNL
jgi:GntR family transcriptional repressor for pyruvate dehydrogenase complex